MRTLLLIGSVAIVLAGCQDRKAAPLNETNNASAPVVAASAEDNAVLGPAIAAGEAKALMHERHEGMEAIGDAFKRVNAQLKGSSPDVAALQKDAAIIADGAGKSPRWFPPGTGPDVGKTRAKAEIWQKPQDFAAKDKAFLEAATAFKAAADSGDLAAIKARAGDLGKSCKACHDPYRAEKGHGG